MPFKYDIRKFESLHERLPQFAEITGQLVEALGLEKTGGRGPKAEPASDRVIRDYVRRRVLSPTLRGSGSEERGFYGFRHLVEFLAARVLLNDGWPLDKIAQHNTGAATDELLALIPGQPEENEALALARSFRRDAQRPTDQGAPFSHALAEASPQAAAIAQPPEFSDRIAVAARRRAELPMLMRQISGDGAPPEVRNGVTFEFGDRLTLIIDRERLRTITVSEADAIGRAISAALIDYPNLTRGKDPK
jgi:hypothetical protein